MADAGQGVSAGPKKRGSGSEWLKTLKNLGPYIAVLVLIGGAFQVGVSMGKDQSAELKEFYRTKINELEKQKGRSQGLLTQAREAQAILRRDLDDCRKPSGQSAIANGSEVAAQNPSMVRAQILAGETATIFKTQLTITVRAIEPDVAPPRYKVITVLGSPGKEALAWEGAPGDRKIFAGFEILIQSVDAASAFFLVEKTGSPPPTQP